MLRYLDARGGGHRERSEDEADAHLAQRRERARAVAALDPRVDDVVEERDEREDDERVEQVELRRLEMTWCIRIAALNHSDVTAERVEQVELCVAEICPRPTRRSIWHACGHRVP